MAEKVDMCGHPMWLDETKTRPILKKMKANGVTTIRDDISWLHTEPTKGQFQWYRTDQLFRSAALEGMKILIIPNGTPVWARAPVPAGSSQVTKPEKLMPKVPADYGNFCGAIVLRYGAHGTFWNGDISHGGGTLIGIELMNETYMNMEPAVIPGFPAGPRPEQYAPVALAGARAIKAMETSLPVILDGCAFNYPPGAQANQSRPWTSKVLQTEPALKDVIDAYADHPYGEPANPRDTGSGKWTTANRMDGHYNQAKALGPAYDKPLWVTEIGWTDQGNQDNYLTEFIEMAYDERSFVEKIFYYDYDSSGFAATTDTWNVIKAQNAKVVTTPPPEPEPTPVPPKPIFTDVPATHPFFKEIEWAYKEGLIEGYPQSNGTKIFKPTGNVSRQAIAAIMYRYDHRT